MIMRGSGGWGNVIQTFSYKVNKFWRPNVQHGGYDNSKALNI